MEGRDRDKIWRIDEIYTKEKRRFFNWVRDVNEVRDIDTQNKVEQEGWFWDVNMMRNKKCV